MAGTVQARRDRDARNRAVDEMKALYEMVSGADFESDGAWESWAHRQGIV